MRETVEEWSSICKYAGATSDRHGLFAPTTWSCDRFDVLLAAIAALSQGKFAAFSRVGDILVYVVMHSTVG